MAAVLLVAAIAPSLVHTEQNQKKNYYNYCEICRDHTMCRYSVSPLRSGCSESG